MKRFSEQLHKKSLTVSLRASERAELRARVQSYMEYHPVVHTTPQMLSKKERAILTEPFRTVSFSPWQFVRYASALACVVMVTISYTAEETVPGDALYPVKVRFNEEVRATLSFTPYQKITWETERLSRRIAEARVLADEGRLTNAVEIEVAEAVRTHSQNARREIAELTETDRDEATLASLHLATTLDVQSVALREKAGEAMSLMSTTEVETTDPVESLLAKVVENERNQTVTPDAATMPAYERVLAHVETDTTRARELLISIRGSATTEELADIERRLADADRTMAEALAKATDDRDGARTLLLDVLRRTQRLIVFMNNIDVREAVQVEELVPVQLTEEERRAKVADAIGFARTTSALTKTALVSATFTATEAERIDYILARIDELLVTADTAIAQGDVSAAEVAGAELHALSLDVRGMVGIDPQSSAPVEEVLTPATTTTPVEPVVSTSTEATSTDTGTGDPAPST